MIQKKLFFYEINAPANQSGKSVSELCVVRRLSPTLVLSLFWKGFFRGISPSSLYCGCFFFSLPLKDFSGEFRPSTLVWESDRLSSSVSHNNDYNLYVAKKFT